MPEAAPRSYLAFAPTSWMSALPPATRLVFHGDRTARAAVGRLFPIPVDDEVCRARVDGERAGLWLGPDEYLLLAPAEQSAASIAQALDAALGATAHAIIDVSHRQIGLEIRGPLAARILNGACPLDLDPAQFPTGTCTRTVLAKADIVLWRPRAEAFRVEVWRSFAPYAIALLTEIARDLIPADSTSA
ncbi:MAG TPA: sarcosine oxidase subunit gamma family protein [Steroidobacteraceae bacterium]|nr:sarcosine oxidase subunit gamma family protein [Steroidobacteraceae bacterium]